MIHSVKTTFAGREFSIETGRVAEQAGGAVLVRYGETVVLATATASKAPREGIDFFPLTVDVEERYYAAGKIPGGFIKREGRPGEHSILAARLTDRPIRPLFPKGYHHDVQVVITVLSADRENDSNILGVTAASAALCVSNIPFAGPVGAVRVGYIDGQIVINPIESQMPNSDLDLAVAATADAVVMVEAGANELPEETMIEAIRKGHEAIQELIKLQNELIAVAGKPKQEFVAPQPDAALSEAVAAFVRPRFEAAVNKASKAERDAALDAVREEMFTELGAQFPDRDKEIATFYDGELKRFVRLQILEKGIRPDGRGTTDIRPISCEVGLLPRTHGSGLFTRGQTQVLSLVTLASPGEGQQQEGLFEDGSKRYIHQYNFPSFSTGETRSSRGPGRREIGHGALAERGLMAVIPSQEEFPYTIRVVSEVLSSNGSTSMGSVCGSTLALMDAGVPIKAPVAGVAMGLITASGDQIDKYAILTDIQGLEDAMGDMDFKVAGTADGVTALQMDIKVKGLTTEILDQAMRQAKVGRMFIMDKMLEALPEPREALSPFAPRIQTLKINPDKIGTVIGPGGKTVRRIQEEAGVKIDIEEDGTIHVAATSGEGMDRALAALRALTEEVEVGKIYTGVVRRLVEFGAFVEILPGKEGLVRTSNLADYFVNRPEEVVSVGDEITVMVIEIDPQGRINLSRRAALTGAMPTAEELEADRPPQRGPGGPGGRGPRGGGGQGGYGAPRGNYAPAGDRGQGGGGFGRGPNQGGSYGGGGGRGPRGGGGQGGGRNGGFGRESEQHW